MLSCLRRSSNLLSRQNKKLWKFELWQKHTRIAVVGGGTGGMCVVGHILRKGSIVGSPSDITIFDPSSTHYYQASFTMVAGGVLGSNKDIDKKLIHRPLSSVFNSSVNLIEDSIGEYDPDNNTIYTLSNNDKYTYDYLIISTGIETRYDLIEGAEEALNDPDQPVGSMYRFDYATKMNGIRHKFKEGKFVATQPQMPIKCGGAPQKFIYLSDYDFRTRNVRSNIDMHFYTQLPVMFPVKKYGDALYQETIKKDINVHFNHNIFKVDGKKHRVHFKDTLSNKEIIETYDLLHIVPPQKPNNVTSTAAFSDSAGYVDVNKHTMQSKMYDNIFALGDCSNLPTSKTAAAILSQGPILVNNLYNIICNKSLISAYDGYTSCPIFTGYDKLMLAEFIYNNIPDETFSMDQSVPKSYFYYMKRYLFPYCYWNLVPNGQWFGRNSFYEPKFVDVINHKEKELHN